MPDGEDLGRPRVPSWEWETPTIWDYKIRLTAHLQDLIERRLLTFEAAERIEGEAYTQVDTEGVSVRLPYYKEIARPSREWLQERGAKVGEALTTQAQQKWIAEHPEEMWQHEVGRFREYEAAPFWAARGQEEEAYPGLLTALREAEGLGVAPRLISEAQAVIGRPEREQIREAWKLSQATKPYKMWQQERMGQAMAGEFPERWGEFKEGFRPGARGIRSPYQQFTMQFQAQPEYEKTMREWRTKQFQVYPQLFPWYQEAGGMGMGKTFQEWIPTEPLAMAHLGRQREAEARRRPPQMAKRWQPAR